MTMTYQPGAQDFTRYLGGLEGQDAPLLGHLVLYSVYESQVTPGQLALWFDQLGLDKIWLPGGIRPSTSTSGSPARPGSRRPTGSASPRPAPSSAATAPGASR
jgi:hypothetical protein